MAGIPLDFDSDELVSSEDESIINPFFNVGRKKVAEMLAFAMKDRLVSKRRVKSLRDLSGAPYQAHQRQLWFNYFRTFRVDILGEDMNATPTGEHVCRFLGHIIERLKSNILGKPAYSKASLKSGMYKLAKRLVFEYADFHLTLHQASRIQALVDSLAREGKLTIGKWRKSQWIGFLTLRSIITSYLGDALLNGVASWDVRISRCLSVVLQANADSRGGEIAQTVGYKGQEFMKWEDVEVKLVGGTRFEHIQAQATIRWEKGSKDDPNSYRLVRWRPLEHFDNAIIDPIVLLMIHALRNGQVEGRTMEEVVQQMATEPSRTLTWTHPTWPIIPAIKSSTTALDFPRPARVGQLHNTLLEAGRLAGIMQDLWLHDLRRGSAKDLKRIKRLDAGVDVRVASALGHSVNAFNRGVTAAYAERESTFLPNARELLSEDPFGPKTALVPYPKPRRLPSHVIDEAAREHPELSRTQLATRIHKDLKRKWEEETSSAVIPPKRRRTAAQEAPPESASSIVSPTSILHGPAPAHASPEDSSMLMPTTLSSEAPDAGSSNCSGVTSNMDPQLLSTHDTEEEGEAASAAYLLRGIISGTAATDGADSPMTEDSRQTSDLEDELVIDALFDHDVQGEREPLQLPLLQLINYFASINTVRKAKKYSPEQLSALGHTVGNSRSPLTLFIKKCAHHDQGCTFEHHNLEELERHGSQKCVYRDDASPEELLERTAPRDWCCSRCDQRFLRKRFLAYHERYGHSIDAVDEEETSWLPKACDQGCTSGHVFTTEARYKDHLWNTHPKKSTFAPQQCALRNVCGLEKYFSSARQYKSHLSHLHRLTKEQSQAYLPVKMATTPYKRQPCPLSGCSMFEKDIPDRNHLVRHLTGKEHGLSEHQARRMAGWDVEEGGSGDEEDDTMTVKPLETPIAKAPVGFTCPIGKCNYAHKGFSERKFLKRHLLSGQHNCSEEEATRLSGINPFWNSAQKT